MTDKYDDFLYQSGLTAQGCWDELDQYAKDAIIRFGDLIVKECLINMENEEGDLDYAIWITKQIFEVED
jgi:hypothetical protein